MSDSDPCPTDLRGFRWPLAALQCKLEWDLDLAVTRRAGLDRQAGQARALLSRLQKETQRQSDWASASMCQTANPAAHRLALLYLLGLSSQATDVSVHLQQLDGSVSQAISEGMALQRRLDILLALRQQALAAHRRRGTAREAREADAAWLAHRWRDDASGPLQGTVS